MVRNLIRNQARSNPLRVRIPCPPLDLPMNSLGFSQIDNALLVESSCACDLARLLTVAPLAPISPPNSAAFCTALTNGFCEVCICH